MALELKLSKPGDTAPKLSLNLAKPARFTVELYWESAHDLDAHALLATNSGAGAKVTSFDQVLSTYNAKKTNPQGTLVTNADEFGSTLPKIVGNTSVSWTNPHCRVASDVAS